MDPGDATKSPAVDGLLRTGELLQLRVADIMMNNQLTFATIDLPDTIGIRDSVSVTRLSFVSLHALYRQSSQTICLHQLVDELSLNNLLLKPYETMPQAYSEPQIHWMVLCSKAAGQANVLHKAGHCNPQHHFRSRRQNEPSL